MPTVFDMIREAIEKKRIVIATYHRHRRMMCPHVLGTKNGRAQALFYQFGGTSSSQLGPPGSSENWRCIPINGLTDVEVVDGDWHTGNRHTQPQTCVGHIVVEVAH